MGSYGLKLTTLTERTSPAGVTMLTGRLGDAIVVALPLTGEGDRPRRWRVTLVTPDSRSADRPPRRAREADLDRLAERARDAMDGPGG